MDGQTFDEFTRDLTTPRTRRGVLASTAGGSLASILGGLGLSALMADDATARKKKKKKKKKCKGNSCGAGRLCVKGKCVAGAGTCPDGANVCGADPFNDPCNGNPNCFCFQKVGGGTRCGTSVTNCGACTTTEECAAHGTGAVCVIAPVDACECTAGQGFCITPCAT